MSLATCAWSWSPVLRAAMALWKMALRWGSMGPEEQAESSWEMVSDTLLPAVRAELISLWT